jgi:small subunit ribosomal protein S6
MRKYETLILFSPDLNSEERQAILNDLTGVVSTYSGQVIETDDWGLRELAYPVQKYTRGHYVRLEYGASGDVVHELERKLRIAEGVFKFLSVKLADAFQPAEEEV